MISSAIVVHLTIQDMFSVIPKKTTWSYMHRRLDTSLLDWSKCLKRLCQHIAIITLRECLPWKVLVFHSTNLLPIQFCGLFIQKGESLNLGEVIHISELQMSSCKGDTTFQEAQPKFSNPRILSRCFISISPLPSSLNRSIILTDIGWLSLDFC